MQAVYSLQTIQKLGAVSLSIPGTKRKKTSDSNEVDSSCNQNY